jgi:prolyl-tRNA editing enzyme YbaK/EbsC (Cys-tRNA(Pro) deacylase)
LAYPAAVSDTAEIQARVLAQLDALGVPYERIPIDPDFADTAAFCERYGVPAANSANTILIAAKKGERRVCACVVAADRKLDVNHAVRGLLGGSRVSFAAADETREISGMQIGGVTALGLPKNLPIYVDAALLELEYVVIGDGGRGAKLKLSPRVFERLPGAVIVPGLGIPRS